MQAFTQPLKMFVAAAPPPPALLREAADAGIHVTHVYGLTEVYGPAIVCEKRTEWSAQPPTEQARLNARQGVPYVTCEGASVLNPDGSQIASDGETMGEIAIRGNMVMKGYLNDPQATAAAFAPGHFLTGDIGVLHTDGYIEVRDRSKDIVISGGENISSIEVERTLHEHPSVLEAAVVAQPDPKWGETPCAFVDVRAGAVVTEAELIEWVRQRIAHFKAPRKVVIGPLPRTSTGKVQKYVLRDRAKCSTTFGSLPV